MAAASFTLAGLLAFNVSPSNASQPYDNPNYNPEGTHTYAAEDPFNPNCPNAIVDTPGSFPATKELVGTNTFAPGSDVHYVYHDNPEFFEDNFVIQDCIATYPADFFDGATFSSGGALIDDSYSKQDLDAGTKLDATEMTGIVPETGDITFKWTVPADVAPGTWVCNFARDVATGHAGEGNRKALPVCGQVPGEQESTRVTAVNATPSTACGHSDVVTIPTTTGVAYSYKINDGAVTPAAGGTQVTVNPGDVITVTAAAASGSYTLTNPEFSYQYTGLAVASCPQTPPPPPPPPPVVVDSPTTTTTEAPTTTTTALPELPFTPEPEIVTTTTAPPAPELAFTGSSTGYLTMMALVMIGFGGLLYAGSNRRRRTTS